MRKLWSSDSYFDFDGKYFKVKKIYLYTKPKTSIQVHFSAFGKESAYLAGVYGDGLVTTSARCSYEVCRDSLFPNFEKGAREAGKDVSKLSKLVLVLFTFESEREFLRSAKEHALGRLAPGALDNPDPREIDLLSGRVSETDMLKRMNFCSGWPDLVELIFRYKKTGVTNICLPCGPNPGLVRDYAKHVLPHFSA
jgi:alkanesulfonate monooxygenase SsuD/methylene tetrahydromethanopterin reductase-like flavin-dependent oxidoreductase (luciferase family)